MATHDLLSGLLYIYLESLRTCTLCLYSRLEFISFQNASNSVIIFRCSKLEGSKSTFFLMCGSPELLECSNALSLVHICLELGVLMNCRVSVQGDMLQATPKEVFLVTLYILEIGKEEDSKRSGVLY